MEYVAKESQAEEDPTWFLLSNYRSNTKKACALIIRKFWVSRDMEKHQNGFHNKPEWS